MVWREIRSGVASGVFRSCTEEAVKRRHCRGILHALAIAVGGLGMAGFGGCKCAVGQDAFPLSDPGYAALQMDDPMTTPFLAARRFCVVVGAAGESEYGEQFLAWAKPWQLMEREKSTVTSIGIESSESGRTITNAIAEGGAVATDKERLLKWVAEASDANEQNWLILIGHGTHDGKSTKFNLNGPDIAAEELARSLDGMPGPWILVVCSASSGPFISKISGPGRIVVTATKSGSEQNFSRFGKYFSEAISDPTGDLDHDHAVSVLEVFLAASDRVAKYYSDQGLLATEQALLDDNGDGKGTPASFYRGVRAVKSPAGGALLDGALARKTILWDEHSKPHLAQEIREEIEQLERGVESLRSKKAEMDEVEYYRELERIFRRLAELQQTKSLGL